MESIYELKQRMALLERAHASASMGHFVLDPKRETIEFSSWVRDNIGLDDMPIPLARLSEIVVKEGREEFYKNFKEALERKENFSFETTILTAKGKARTQRVSGITAFESEHTREGLIGYFGILQEITHEKRSKEELRAARDAAQAELDARTNFLAVVSHEIRTPLGGILGVIDQLKRERSAAERERALVLIEDSSEVLLDTLDAILQQARIGNDTGNLDRKRFAPLSVAHRVAELFRPLARRKGLRIEVNGPSDAYVLGDPARLQQIIANFVSNAVKFTQSGIVSIEVCAPVSNSNRWRFDIKDTGAGMDKSRVANIFEPFGVSSTDSLGRKVGTGLGLSITRELVGSLSGKIKVESELGKGSTFTVDLPFEHAVSDAGTHAVSSKRGSAVILVERASDRVQAEATASTHGFDLIDLYGENTAAVDHVSPIVLIADSDKLDQFSKEQFEQFERVIVIVTDRDGLSDMPPQAVGVSVSTVRVTQIARSISEVLGEIHNDET